MKQLFNYMLRWKAFSLEAIGVHCNSELFFKAIAAIRFASLHSIINKKNGGKYEIATQEDFLTI